MVRFSLVCVMLRIMYIAQQAQSGIHLRKLGRGGGGGETYKKADRAISKLLIADAYRKTGGCYYYLSGKGQFAFFFQKDDFSTTKHELSAISR